MAALLRAAELARRGLGDVEPNPPVGAIVLAAGAVVGEGWHAAFGGPHAEIAALADAGERAQGATIAVTLEPCSTRGKTGPCTEALVAAGVARVVVGARDPNPAHGGRGLERLRRAGIEVVELGQQPAAAGVQAQEACASLLERFRRGLSARRPFVLAKWAMSSDGAIAGPGGTPVALTGAKANERVHAWRASLDALVVGVGTVLTDDPLLTARGQGPILRPLRRVVLDPHLRTPLDRRLVTTAQETPTWVYGTEPVDPARAGALRERGCVVHALPAGERWLADVFASLHAQGVRRALVEGGATTLTRLLAAGLADHVAVFVAPVELGQQAVPALRDRPLAGLSPEALASALDLQQVVVESLGPDVLVRGFSGPGPGPVSR